MTMLGALFGKRTFPLAWSRRIFTSQRIVASKQKCESDWRGRGRLFEQEDDFLPVMLSGVSQQASEDEACSKMSISIGNPYCVLRLRASPPHTRPPPTPPPHTKK